MRFLPDHKRIKIAVIGLGYVGTCVAGTMADRGFDVVGVDTDSRLIDELSEGYCRFQEHGLAELLRAAFSAGRLSVTTDYAAVSTADVVLITVGTPVQEDGSLADAQLRGACTALAEYVRPGQLLVVKSTVPPGTTRNFVLPLLGRKVREFGLSFAPERLAEGTALRDLNTLPVVVGGVDADSTVATAEFWRRVLGVEVISLESAEAAEIVKLADNWWIDLNIALANELAKFSALFNVDVLDVIAAANTIQKGTGNVNILLPSVGVGGSCLTKDPWMVWHAARQRGLQILTAPAGRDVNAGMPEYTAQLAIDGLAELGKDPATAKVAVLGLAFKNNTGDLRATPTQGTVAALCKAGAQVRIYDPLVDEAAAESLFGFKPARTLREAVQDADCVAVLALHREFESIDFSVLPVAASCLVIDGRAYYSKDAIAALRRSGYHYRGIGR